MLTIEERAFARQRTFTVRRDDVAQLEITSRTGDAETADARHLVVWLKSGASYQSPTYAELKDALALKDEVAGHLGVAGAAA